MSKTYSHPGRLSGTKQNPERLILLVRETEPQSALGCVYGFQFKLATPPSIGTPQQISWILMPALATSTVLLNFSSGALKLIIVPSVEELLVPV